MESGAVDEMRQELAHRHVNITDDSRALEKAASSLSVEVEVEFGTLFDSPKESHERLSVA